MIRAIIVEDEKKSRETLRGLINRYCSKDVMVVDEAEGVVSGINSIKNFHPDLVFLDIQMPDGSGFKLLESIPHIDFDVIFTTAFDQYAIKAIKYSALDYLLKPIEPDDLLQAIEKVNRRNFRSQIDQNIRVLLDNYRNQFEEPRKIVLSTSDKIHVVDVDDIIRCESDNYYTKFFFKDGKTLLISKTLKEHELLLKEHNFIRPHKSHLINIKYIKSFIRADGGYIMLTDSSRIPVSRRKRERILDIISHL